MSALEVLTLTALLGTGLIAGTFFAFSSFLMDSLAARPAQEAIAAMQAINEKVLNLSFLGTFFGTGLLSLVLIVGGLRDGVDAGSAWRLAGAGLYLIGTLLVTILFNVPRNEALARSDALAPDADEVWARYNREWTRWNTVRTTAAFLATGALAVALMN